MRLFSHLLIERCRCCDGCNMMMMMNGTRSFPPLGGKCFTSLNFLNDVTAKKQLNHCWLLIILASRRYIWPHLVIIIWRRNRMPLSFTFIWLYQRNISQRFSLCFFVSLKICTLPRTKTRELFCTTYFCLIPKKSKMNQHQEEFIIVAAAAKNRPPEPLYGSASKAKLLGEEIIETGSAPAKTWRSLWGHEIWWEFVFKKKSDFNFFLWLFCS